MSFRGLDAQRAGGHDSSPKGVGITVRNSARSGGVGNKVVHLVPRSLLVRYLDSDVPRVVFYPKYRWGRCPLRNQFQRVL